MCSEGIHLYFCLWGVAPVKILLRRSKPLPSFLFCKNIVTVRAKRIELIVSINLSGKYLLVVLLSEKHFNINFCPCLEESRQVELKVDQRPTLLLFHFSSLLNAENPPNPKVKRGLLLISSHPQHPVFGPLLTRNRNLPVSPRELLPYSHLVQPMLYSPIRFIDLALPASPAPNSSSTDSSTPPLHRPAPPPHSPKKTSS